MQVDSSETQRFHWELASEPRSLAKLEADIYPILVHYVDQELYFQAVHEMVINAMEHGNQFDPHKMIWVDMMVNEDYVMLTVEDQGEGFDWRRKKESKKDIFHDGERGRGLIMTEQISDHFFYNEAGNKAHILFYGQRKEA